MHIFFLRRTVAAVIICLLAVMLCGCGKKTVPPVQTPMPAAEGLRIAVASDLHFNPDTSENAYDQGAVKYNTQLVGALLYDVESEGADVLLLTGDLVNSGKTEHHRALAEKLHSASDAGVAVYVLPGNHDLAPIGQQEFAALYGEFGYNDAYSRDSASLSYCIMRSDVCLLMLDTGGYPADTIDLPDAPQRENDTALVCESTLQWAHRMLQDELRAYADQNIADMDERNPLTRRETQQAVEFFYAVMDAYWQGDLAAEREALLAMPGCEPFFRCAEGYAYGWWLRKLIDTATPMLGGFRLNM